ncbi:hypothetical protein QQS21_002922 [Conoideocrella luteorostrata]|uniref:MARVEL domain-containing protein n=1 Tax=Conoideocrella luteorostrata TaxID=1105319 RepID=A0AAJ0CX57_9HYPO|nr:hypothetical protein QQS21_002922 [Conoideocrella luteorostrata]
MELPSIARLALFGAIALLNIISLALLAYVINSWRGGYYSGYIYYYYGTLSSVNFMLFNTIWTLLVLVYLGVVPHVAAALYHGIIALALLAITTLFWFAGSIALAVFVGARDCVGSGICSVYKAAQAATAFGFFIWIMFTVLLVFELLGFLKHGLKGRANADTTGTKMTPQTAPQTYSNA